MGLCDQAIAKLEAELAADSSDDDSSDASDASDAAPAVESTRVADGVLASLESERIAPLPARGARAASQRTRGRMDARGPRSRPVARRPRDFERATRA